MRCSIALLALAAVAGCGGAHQVRPGPDPADPMTHERVLAAIARTHHGTRAAGTSGDATTADYVADRLAQAGMAVHRQRFRVLTSVILSPARVQAGGRAVDAVPLEFTGSGDVTAALHRVRGFGCRRADYAGLPRGAIAVAQRGSCFFRVKALNAQRAGAAAVLVQSGHAQSGTLVAPGVRIPALAVGRDLPVSGRAHVSVAASTRRAWTENVIGETREGPAGRVVMAGAHLDSVPTGPGVNDDGSGVSALLAIAKRLDARPVKGARVRLGFWAAEEIGLVGSWRYTHSLSRRQRHHIAAYVNLDMIASPHPVRQMYGDASVMRVLRTTLPGLEPVNVGARSDHWSFQSVGIPAGGLFSGDEPAQDPCYHRACDGLGNVNAASLHAMTDAAEQALRRLATR
jgi:Iap family predicted aminopeptidase